jgi:high-affinity nickel-transport protein
MLANPFDDRPSRASTKVAVTYGMLLGGNTAAWVWARLAFADRPALLGIAFLAYLYGLRHAFDADHIAAIDNVVGKLMQYGKAPYTAGLFFSLGHSSIVVLASIAIATTATALDGRLGVLNEMRSAVGTVLSALFLLIMGIANLVILLGVWAAFIRVSGGEAVTDEALDTSLAGRGAVGLHLPADLPLRIALVAYQQF